MLKNRNCKPESRDPGGENDSIVRINFGLEEVLLKVIIRFMVIGKITEPYLDTRMGACSMGGLEITKKGIYELMNKSTINQTHHKSFE